MPSIRFDAIFPFNSINFLNKRVYSSNKQVFSSNESILETSSISNTADHTRIEHIIKNSIRNAVDCLNTNISWMVTTA